MNIFFKILIEITLFPTSICRLLIPSKIFHLIQHSMAADLMFFDMHINETT